ncbi:hypothetical protein HOE49_04305 [Candidatus Peregrinibacteria bacterium]|jgi:hypothetical protein|nr:hypothetical protein [Candidatus Peregrinibacteria bacterium]MBT4148470.1 hypothetical protein [Candidatus Peregrinibacteria bacterium]
MKQKPCPYFDPVENELSLQVEVDGKSRDIMNESDPSKACATMQIAGLCKAHFRKAIPEVLAQNSCRRPQKHKECPVFTGEQAMDSWRDSLFNSQDH